MALTEDLSKIIKGEISDSEADLINYSHDASIFEIRPQLIVFPKDVDDIKALVKYASKNNLSITPRSAGTDMSGGAINDGLILDMTKYFNRIIRVSNDSAVVQPGVYYRDFEKATLEKGLIMPSFPASKDLCCVGGIVANNSGGERTLAFGQTFNYVNGLKIILSDGNEYEFSSINKKDLDKKMSQNGVEGQIYSDINDLIVKNGELIKKARPTTHKNSTGYLLWEVNSETNFDLAKIFVGSQGTLGIITEIEFELTKVNPHQALLVIEMNNLTNLDKIVAAVLGLKPQAFECYDDQTIQFALRFLPELQTHFKLNNPSEVNKAFFGDKIKNMFGKLPKLTLLAQFTGQTEPEAIEKADQAKAKIKQFKVSTKILKTDKSSEKYWVIRHESFNMLRHHAQHMRSAPFIDDFIVKPEHLPEFLPKLNAIIDKYKASLGPEKFIYTLAGHIGDGNFHIIPLVDLNSVEVRSAIPLISEEVFHLVFEYQGSMSAEHNDGLVRGMFLPEMYGEQVYQLFKKVKEIFDPKNIFNPHKKVDATYDFSYKHFANS